MEDRSTRSCLQRATLAVRDRAPGSSANQHADAMDPRPSGGDVAFPALAGRRAAPLASTDETRDRQSDRASDEEIARITKVAETVPDYAGT